MDELNHAVTSFEMASLLTGQPLQPGALPPSKHAFTQDLMSLAVSTAREGCIAETLSALELAVEVDSASVSAEVVDGAADDNDVVDMLMQKTRIIALEEGRHSMLAWRTIHCAALAAQHAIPSRETCLRRASWLMRSRNASVRTREPTLTKLKRPGVSSMQR
jgi:hypothetical protein